MRHLRHLSARKGEESPRRIAGARILAGAVVVAALVWAWWADTTACPVALLFGIPCPGCGLGRATLALLTGHPIEAYRLHPLVFVALPALFVFVAYPTNAAAERRRPRSWAGSTVAAAALLASVLAVWIARFEGAFGGPVPVRSVWTSTR